MSNNELSERIDWLECTLETLKLDQRKSIENYQKLCQQTAKRSRQRIQTATSSKIIIDIEISDILEYVHFEIVHLAIMSDSGVVLYDQTFCPMCIQRGMFDRDEVVDKPFLITELPKINTIMKAADEAIGYGMGFIGTIFRYYGIVCPRFHDIMPECGKRYGYSENPDGYVADYSIGDMAEIMGYDWSNCPDDNTKKCRGILYCYNKLNDLTNL